MTAQDKELQDLKAKYNKLLKEHEALKAENDRLFGKLIAELLMENGANSEQHNGNIG